MQAGRAGIENPVAVVDNDYRQGKNGLLLAYPA